MHLEHVVGYMFAAEMKVCRIFYQNIVSNWWSIALLRTHLSISTQYFRDEAISSSVVFVVVVVVVDW